MLKPCPYCGSNAMGPYTHRQNSYGVVGEIKCSNVKCRAEIQFQADIDKGEYSAHAEKEVTRRWNKRV